SGGGREIAFHHSGTFHNRPPNVGFKFIGVDEPVAVSWKDECRLGIAALEISQDFHHTLSGCDSSKRFPGLGSAEVPLPLVNPVLRSPLRKSVLNPDFVAEPSNASEP